MRLAGKSVVITGAANGIGRASATLFAREGASVVLADIDVVSGRELADEIIAAGGQARMLRCDVTSSHDLRATVEFAVAEFGALDIFWHNAGTAGSSDAGGGPEYADDDMVWDQQMDIHLKSGFTGARLAAKQMRDQGGGAILFTSSAASLRPKASQPPAYPIAKNGVNLLTRMMAASLAPFGVRVNAICPSAVATPMMTSILQDPAGRAVIDGIVQEMPMGRMLRPEEIAAAALFLVSDEASAITGVVMPVDGGRTLV